MKNIFKIILVITLFIWFISISNAVDLSWIWSDIKDSSISSIRNDDWNIVTTIETTWKSLLTSVKVILEWILLIFIVYLGFQMVMSLWKNEEDLTKAKTQLRYSIIWIMFVNIPWTLYQAFNWWNPNSVWGRFPWSTWSNTPWNSDSNLFVNIFDLWTTLNSNIVWFIEAGLVWIAIIMLTFSWIKILTSRWREDIITNEKEKISWSIIWLVFVWFISAWKNLAFSWNISDWVNLYETLSNLALFFAWPVAILFLTLSWYYYITANGDDEKVKKAKNIIINVIIWTVILLASYSFLLDLADF